MSSFTMIAGVVVVLSIVMFGVVLMVGASPATTVPTPTPVLPSQTIPTQTSNPFENASTVSPTPAPPTPTPFVDPNPESEWWVGGTLNLNGHTVNAIYYHGKWWYGTWWSPDMHEVLHVDAVANQWTPAEMKVGWNDHW
jgi:hypothetical protein